MNIAVRKYCEEHNRTREVVKELEEWRKRVEEGDGNNLRRVNINGEEDGLEDEEGNYYSNGV